jgi:hypothetical protein
MGDFMSSADPLPPSTLRPRQVQASILAAFQLVEDAHYLGSPRRRRRGRARILAERAVADRRLARDLQPS